MEASSDHCLGFKPARDTISYTDTSPLLRTPFTSTRCQLRDERRRIRSGTRDTGMRRRSTRDSPALHFSGVYLILLYVRRLRLHLIVVENHLPHQHHQLVHVSPGLQHKVARMARHRHVDVHVVP
ncbi:hypothetical protein EYF80_039295 [Liparis tanakae]|uniref:Uncharacterized protein n=1 Tax=Liparis tanakae TaxID=230148 RepID=A0A4Z2GBN2_9TELE|nr:hypothetical protein EYF80_039295 [Liparis tanakae]